MPGFWKYHYALPKGNQRPRWAGPWRIKYHPVPGEEEDPQQELLHTIESFSGIILPLKTSLYSNDLHPKTRHSFGAALAMPDLRGHFLGAQKDSALAKPWTEFEQSLHQAALRKMGWNEAASHQEASRAALPDYAFHLSMRRSDLPEKGKEEPGQLLGTITKMFPMRDASGTRTRFEKEGSPAGFKLDRRGVRWEKHPELL